MMLSIGIAVFVVIIIFCVILNRKMKKIANEDNVSNFRTSKPSLPDKYITQEHNEHLDFEKVDEKLDKEQYRPALKALDAFLPIPEKDVDRFREIVDECFYWLADDKNPIKVIELYEDLRDKSQSFAAATENGPTLKMVDSFELSLDNTLPKKGRATTAVALSRSYHPLCKGLRYKNPHAFVVFLNITAEDIFNEWFCQEIPKHISDDVAIERLSALLEKRITPDALAKEWGIEID